MAAVAEYGKAVEVLLEDPDTEKPNHPSELFARIRSIAPGVRSRSALPPCSIPLRGKYRRLPSACGSTQEHEAPQADGGGSASAVAPCPGNRWRPCKPMCLSLKPVQSIGRANADSGSHRAGAICGITRSRLWQRLSHKDRD